MKTLLATCASLLMLSGFSASATVVDPGTQAQAAAKSWLALTDSGKYAESWNQAALYFQSAITKPKWEAALQAARTPLGAVKSRTLKLLTYAHTLPHAPAGDYFVIQYVTAFANKPQATETITPMKEKDGSWKVAGYFIK